MANGWRMSQHRPRQSRNRLQRSMPLNENARNSLMEMERSMNKDRMSVLTAMMDQGVIPVFYHPDVEVCKKVIQACANGGAKCIEFTNRGDFAAHVFYDVT